MVDRGDFSIFPVNEENEGFNVSDYDLKKCTGRQRSYIYGLLDKANMELHELFADLGYDYESARDLTINEAGECINRLKDILNW